MSNNRIVIYFHDGAVHNCGFICKLLEIFYYFNLWRKYIYLFCTDLGLYGFKCFPQVFSCNPSMTAGTTCKLKIQ